MKIFRGFNDVILSFYCLSILDKLQLQMQKKCPLCNNLSNIFYKDTQTYYKCDVCCGIFVSSDDLPDEMSEKQRYELHDSDTEDEGYRKFVYPITSSILSDFSKDDCGLDFGAGTSTIISTILKQNGYKVADYDPYFHNNQELLTKQYDYISSCEVIEHFYNPYKEFKLLKSLLKPQAKLYLMTDIYDEKTDFASWYYKNDPTHVFLYTKETFTWIKKKSDFSDVFIDKRLVRLFA